jgi:pentapeptide repeat protein
MPDSEEKQRLEIKKLKQDTGLWARFSSVFWPIVASLFTVVLGYATWQSSQQEMKRQDVQKQREFVSSALRDTTDANSSATRQIAGMWQVNALWTEEDEATQDLMAATLASVLGSSPDVQVRCIAAEVIGNAITEPDSFVGHSGSERAAHLAHFLYGHKSGTIGVVVFQNLQTKTKFASLPVQRCYGDADANPLDATKEAVRKNWEYLRDVNLTNTNLEGTWLYGADLQGALLQNARLAGVNLRCANIAEADFSGSDLTGADFFLARADKISPETLQKSLPPAMLFHGTERDWLQWRENKFRVRKDSNTPVLKKDDNRSEDVFPCYDLRPDRPNIVGPNPSFNQMQPVR